jgi:hypothetical protein
MSGERMIGRRGCTLGVSTAYNVSANRFAIADGPEDRIRGDYSRQVGSTLDLESGRMTGNPDLSQTGFQYRQTRCVDWSGHDSSGSVMTAVSANWDRS